jgi:hypothetical protein
MTGANALRAAASAPTKGARVSLGRRRIGKDQAFDALRAEIRTQSTFQAREDRLRPDRVHEAQHQGVNLARQLLVVPRVADEIVELLLLARVLLAQHPDLAFDQGHRRARFVGNAEFAQQLGCCARKPGWRRR